MASAPTTSNLVGAFRINEEIGRGSFATVYVGRREGSEERVAIKSVARSKLNRKLAENLESEIRIMKDMNHPNIVTLVEIVKTETHIHLVMEFCRLGDLSAYIKKKGAVAAYGLPPVQMSSDLASPWGGINEAVVRHFLAMLASALETLRSLSLIHRDLKPQNLLLDPPPDGSPPVTILSPYLNGPPITIPALPILKLADFGFARALPQQSLASTLCGSPLYMAPEILRGDRYDAKVDLWSLGTILYEMITGRPPYKAQNHIDLLRKIDKGEGFVKFPGEEDTPSPNGGRGKGMMSNNPTLTVGTAPVTSTMRRIMGGASLPNNAKNIPVGSLGMTASPKFPSTAGAMHAQNIGSRPVSDDLKDLTRRLLKRNPVERMSFEEFFMHPAVVSAGPPQSLQLEASLSEGTSPSCSDESIRIADSAVSGNSGNTAVNPVPSSASTAKQVSAAPPMPQHSSTKSSSTNIVNPLLPDPTSTPFPPSALRQVPSLSPQSVSKPKVPYSSPIPFASNAPLTLGGNRKNPASDEILDKDNLFDDLEPPFGGYDNEPPKNLFVQTAPPQPQATAAKASVLPSFTGGGGRSSKTLVAGAPSKRINSLDEDGSSSISSLGSLELSEEMEEAIAQKIPPKTSEVKVGSLPNAVNKLSSLIRGTSSKATPRGSTGTKASNDKTVASPPRQSKGLKSSLDDFVVIDQDSKPTEVNWIAASGGGEATDIAGLSDAMQSAVVPVAIQPGAFNKRQSGGSAGAFTNSASPPQSPISNRRIQQATTTTTHSESLRGSRVSFDRGSSGGGPHGGGSDRGMVVGSAGSGYHEYGTRIFGSLRESAHHFLDAMTPVQGHAFSGGHAGNGRGDTTMAAAVTPVSGTSSPAAMNPASSWTVEMQDEASLLTVLNLSTVRGHAVHSFADEMHRDLVLAMAQQQSEMVQEQQQQQATPAQGRAGSYGAATDTVLSAGVVNVIAEESLTLYLTALRLYQFGLESARALWSREQIRLARLSAGSIGAGDHPGEGVGGSVCVDLKSLNASVQWMKEKFDDCLGRAQEVRGVIVGGDGVGEERGGGGGSAGGVPRPVDRMIYERSLDVCRAAAQAEATGSFQSAEYGYTQAVHLLEAILYAPPPSTLFQGGSLTGSLMDSSLDEGGAPEMSENDRIVVERFLGSIGKRLTRLREVVAGGGSQSS
ncbi:Serine/threonine-protein kinase [Chytriomyces hyalinus]|nr:Serine/threonine-protein kinase [Chytriomyces hyalinus]